MLESNFPLLGLPRRGKVRDNYDLTPYMLMVATDRISAFDVVLPNGIPEKGVVLTTLSALWLAKLAEIIPNHLATCDPAEYPRVCQPYIKELDGRSMLVEKNQPLPVECVVRGYLAGSAYKLYKAGQNVCGVILPPGLVESDHLPQPIFTPTTKAQQGHDENITFEQVIGLVGEEVASIMRAASLALYAEAQMLAEKAGIIIADTKFEFGIDDRGRVALIDEVLTPDSSRFWPIEGYKPGRTQPSYDKQFVRDYLDSIGWNRRPPAPKLPPEIVQKTSKKYLEAYELLALTLVD